jgi:hypothetical protein
MLLLQSAAFSFVAIGAIVGTSAIAVEARAELGVDVISSPLPVAGSRLAPIFLEGDDESRQFVGWFDRARGDNCAFGLAGDGVVRCLPSDIVEARFFADAACTLRMAVVGRRSPAAQEPVARQGAPAEQYGCSAPKYLVENETAVCGSDVRHHIFEARVAVRPVALYAQENGACPRVAIDAVAMYVAVGREVPPASFVAARYTTGRPAFGLKTEYEPHRP